MGSALGLGSRVSCFGFGVGFRLRVGDIATSEHLHDGVLNSRLGWYEGYEGMRV